MLVTGIVLCNALVPFERLLPPLSIRAREEGELRVHFLDVGQGDCTIVEFPSGDLLIADAGDGSFGERTKLARYLKGLSYRDLSMLATHADLDHYGGFESLLRAFGADTVYLPSVDGENDRYLLFRSAVIKSGAEIKTITRYGVIADESGAYAVCISPRSSEEELDDNDASTVLWLHYDGVSVLLAGDISAEREAFLTAEYALMEGIFDSGDYAVRLEDTNILKVAHHGSQYACSAEWLAMLSVQTAVISCGKDNSYSHPSEGAMKRLEASGAEVYRTDELGNIVVAVQNGGYTVEYGNKTKGGSL